MSAKRIFILNGHPGENSLSRLMAETYAKAARTAGHDVRVRHLHDLEFDTDYGDGGYSHPKTLEPVLEHVLNDLEWSEHLVLTTPMWWGGIPAKLKGLIDRILLPGRAFDTRNPKPSGLPSPMLSGRTARVILTSDTPGWFFRLVYHKALMRQLRDQILGFVGFKPSRFTHLSGASHPKDGLIASWVRKVEKIGAQAA